MGIGLAPQSLQTTTTRGGALGAGAVGSAEDATVLAGPLGGSRGVSTGRGAATSVGAGATEVGGGVPQPTSAEASTAA
jgi:hypothetical protein